MHFPLNNSRSYWWVWSSDFYALHFKVRVPTVKGWPCAIQDSDSFWISAQLCLVFIPLSSTYWPWSQDGGCSFRLPVQETCRGEKKKARWGEGMRRIQCFLYARLICISLILMIILWVQVLWYFFHFTDWENEGQRDWDLPKHSSLPSRALGPHCM